MAVLLGLVLTLLGALIGSFLLFAILAIASSTPASQFTSSEIPAIAFYGTIIGSVLAAPVGVVMLPACYAVLRRSSHLSLTRLTIAGAICGFVSVVVIAVLLFGLGTAISDRSGALVTLSLAADGAATGAICGHLFARGMRAMNPESWQPPA